MKFKDFAGVAATLTRMGFLSEEGEPSMQFYSQSARREAQKLLNEFWEDGEIAPQLPEFIRDILAELVQEKHADALRSVLEIVYERYGLGQPELFLLLDQDDRLLLFCDALVDSLDELIE
ncbi:MAG: hypothetical protein HFG20_11570 [Anaerotruncus sp.]|nr:hypothetical protein [Anaerotruncus sp.]